MCFSAVVTKQLEILFWQGRFGFAGWFGILGYWVSWKPYKRLDDGIVKL